MVVQIVSQRVYQVDGVILGILVCVAREQHCEPHTKHRHITILHTCMCVCADRYLRKLIGRNVTLYYDRQTVESNILKKRKERKKLQGAKSNIYFAPFVVISEYI